MVVHIAVLGLISQARWSSAFERHRVTGLKSRDSNVQFSREALVGRLERSPRKVNKT